MKKYLLIPLFLVLACLAQDVARQTPFQEIQWKVECPVCKDTFGFVPTTVKTNEPFKSVSATVYNRSAEATCPQCGTRFTAMRQNIVPDVMAEEVVTPISRQHIQERIAAHVPRFKIVPMVDVDEGTLLDYRRTNASHISLLILTRP
jgi:ribosomal protein S27E